MKVIQNLFLIFFFIFITKDLFAGLGNTTWGAGGIKRDIEVNEIDPDMIDKKEEKKKEKDPSEIENKFKIKELEKLDPKTIGTISEKE